MRCSRVSPLFRGTAVDHQQIGGAAGTAVTTGGGSQMTIPAYGMHYRGPATLIRFKVMACQVFPVNFEEGCLL